ncbi:hypothetical protein ACXYMU_13470 [Pontibacter sp. CAU 1760]
MAYSSGNNALSLLGKAYLYLRYREKGRVQRELAQKYQGQFENAATVLLADIFMALAVVVVVSLLAGALYLIIA